MVNEGSREHGLGGQWLKDHTFAILLKEFSVSRRRREKRFQCISIRSNRFRDLVIHLSCQ